tara:strand:+ start:678 stop:941 length:264 start_codon:yes stop_codon:yes gene_type:complete
VNEEQIRQWFGERGYPISEEAKITFKIIDKWLFIHNSEDEYDEVESYYLDTSFCEPIGGYPTKNFDWSTETLTNKAKDLRQYLPADD